MRKQRAPATVKNKPVLPSTVATAKKKVSLEAETIAQLAEQALLAGDGLSAGKLARAALEKGGSPLAHSILARSCVAAGCYDEALDHFDKAAALDANDWRCRLEAIEELVESRAGKGSGVGLPIPLAIRCEVHARECVAIVERNRSSKTLPREDRAFAVAVELRARGVWSRLLRCLGQREPSTAVLAAAEQLASTHLNPATAKLPRLTAKSRGKPLALPGGRKVVVEQLSRYPPLFRIKNLLSDAECAHVIECAKPLLNLSGIATKGGGQEEGFRTSTTAWVRTAEDKPLRQLTERVASLLSLPASGLLNGQAADSGNMQVVHYLPGQQYGVHHDCNGLIRRYATCLYYLTDVEEGGGTWFPAASDRKQDHSHLTTSDAMITHFLAPEHRKLSAGVVAEEDLARDAALSKTISSSSSSFSSGRPGVVCKPSKGDAIVWYNYDESGKLDPRAVHSALPVLRGEKWAANHWISLAPQGLLIDVG